MTKQNKTKIIFRGFIFTRIALFVFLFTFFIWDWTSTGLKKYSTKKMLIELERNFFTFSDIYQNPASFLGLGGTTLASYNRTAPYPYKTH